MRRRSSAPNGLDDAGQPASDGLLHYLDLQASENGHTIVVAEGLSPKVRNQLQFYLIDLDEKMQPVLFRTIRKSN